MSQAYLTNTRSKILAPTWNPKSCNLPWSSGTVELLLWQYCTISEKRSANAENVRDFDFNGY